MEFWEISLYSLVQGITEFLPISSSAHLFILEKILNWPIPGRTMAIAAHLGSLFAVILYLKYDLINIIKSLFKVGLLGGITYSVIYFNMKDIIYLSERNLYSKQLLEAKEDITSMKILFRSMNHDINQMKG